MRPLGLTGVLRGSRRRSITIRLDGHLMYATDLDWPELRWFEGEADFGDEAVEESVAAVLHPFQPGLDGCGELVDTVRGEVGQPPAKA